MKRINKDVKYLESKCDGVYYTEALDIVKALKMTVLVKENSNCIGLAHNQIKGDKRVFIAKLNNVWTSFINPTIIKTSDKKNRLKESCMSFPDKYSTIERYAWVELEHQVKARNDSQGDMFKTERFVGFDARIIQHEMDHLDGIHIFNKL